MGKPKYLPTGKVLEDSVTRAAESGEVSSGSSIQRGIPVWREARSSSNVPGSAKAVWCQSVCRGIGPLTLFWSMVDRGIDSLQFGGKIAYDIIAKGGLTEVVSWHQKKSLRSTKMGSTITSSTHSVTITEEYCHQPEVEQSQPQTHYDLTADYLVSCGHPYAGQVASHWVHSHNRLENNFDGSVLSMVGGSTGEVYKRLRTEFPGLGPKTTPLFWRECRGRDWPGT